MEYGRREQDEAAANFSFMLSEFEDEAIRQNTEFAFTQLQALSCDPRMLIRHGNEMYCGPEKRFREGAFLCKSGRRIMWPWAI